MSKITRELAEKLIKSTAGAIFGATFIKANGEFRDMTCRIGVRKGVNGKGLAFDPADYDLKTVYDMQAKGFRMLNLNTLYRLTVDGKTYEVIQ